MSILAWVVLGLIAGFIGSKIVNKSGEGLLLDIILGIVGAIVGGWLFSFFGAHGVTGVNIYSLVGSVLIGHYQSRGRCHRINCCTGGVSRDQKGMSPTSWIDCVPGRFRDALLSGRVCVVGGANSFY